MHTLVRAACTCFFFGLSWATHGCRESPRATADSPAEAAATASSDAASCAPDDARGDGPCERVVGFVWDGHKCGYTSGCVCIGRDCKRYQSLGGCEAAHAACK